MIKLLLAAFLGCLSVYLTSLIPGNVITYEYGSLRTADRSLFWIATELFRQGFDPYSFDHIAHYIELLDLPIGVEYIWGQPSLFLYLLPFSIFGIQKFFLLIALVSGALLAAMLALGVRLFKPKRAEIVYLQLLAAVSFLPFYYSIYVAPLIPLIALSLIAFLAYPKHRLSIVFLILISFKPHLSYLFLTFLFTKEILVERNLALFAQYALLSIGLYLTIHLINPETLPSYLKLVQDFPMKNYFSPALTHNIYHISPTIGSLLSKLLPILSIVVIMYLSMSKKITFTPRTVYLLIMPITLLSVPYYREYDLILLIPAFFIMIKESPIYGTLLVALFNILLFTLIMPELYVFIPLVPLLYFFLESSVDNITTTTTNGSSDRKLFNPSN